MKGCITRRGTRSWRLKYDVGRDENARRITRYRTVNGTKTEAQKALNKILNEIDEHRYVDLTKKTVGEFLREWLEAVNVSARTKERYAEHVELHLVPALGAIPLAKLGPLQIQRYYRKAQESGRRDGKGGLSARTVHHQHRILFQALRQAVKWDMLARNPVERVEPPSPAAVEIQALNEQELGQLLKAAAGTRIYTSVLLAASTGLRRGEVLGLRWKDLDLDTAVLQVSQSIEQTKDGLAFKAPKTKRSRRSVDLPAITVEELRRHKIRQMEERLQFGKDYRDHGLVFAQYDGRPINPRAFSKEFARVAKRSAVPHISFHGLRHTHLTHLLKSGVNPKIASERAGHASVAITLDVYSHVLPGMQKEVAKGVDAAIRTSLEQ